MALQPSKDGSLGVLIAEALPRAGSVVPVGSIVVALFMRAAAYLPTEDILFFSVVASFVPDGGGWEGIGTHRATTPGL